MVELGMCGEINRSSQLEEERFWRPSATTQLINFDQSTDQLSITNYLHNHPPMVRPLAALRREMMRKRADETKTESKKKMRKKQKKTV